MTIQDELRQIIPNHTPEILRLLDERDGATKLATQFLPENISQIDASTNQQLRRVWELCGLYYKTQNRFHEALSIFHALYDHILAHQEKSSTLVHKGMPLVWISECYSQMNYPVLAKRYLMLTACEDAISEEGKFSPQTSGVYFRMVWLHGLSHQDTQRYASRIYEIYKSASDGGRFPEWILQELDPTHEWLTEYPLPQEAALYSFNKKYVGWLLGKLGEGDGKGMERLAHYLLSCMPGCRPYMRLESHTTDYDVVCASEGSEMDFRSELGRYFLCECKDWKKPVDTTYFAKFCRILDSAKCRFGIIFSREGISGENKSEDAEREQLKVFQDRGMVIVVFSKVDLEKVAQGENFMIMLRKKYEKVRLDLPKEPGTSANLM